MFPGYAPAEHTRPEELSGQARRHGVGIVTISRLERKEQLVAREKADPTATTVGVEAADGGEERERAYHGGRGARTIEGGSTGMIDGGGGRSHGRIMKTILMEEYGGFDVKRCWNHSESGRVNLFY